MLNVNLPATAPSLQELFQYGLYVILGPGITPPDDVVVQANDYYFQGFPQNVKDALEPLTEQLLTIGGLNLLQDGIDSDGDVSPTDVLVTVGDDEYGTRWIEFGFHLGQQITFDIGGGFDLGIHRFTDFFGNENAARYDSAVPTEADKDSYANFLKDFGWGTALQSSSGLRADAKWDARLGFGLSERLGRSGSAKNGFYVNGGQTVSGRADDEPIEEFRASFEVYAAPNNEATTFGELFEDTVTTPNLKATATIGVLEATISDGTAAEVKITAPNGLPLDLGGTTFGKTEFVLDITRDGGETTSKTITLDAIQNVLAAPALLPTLNAQLFAAYGSILPPVSFNVDFSPIDTFYNPGAPNTPFLVLSAREPDISHLAIRPKAGSSSNDASAFGFLPTQFEDRRVLGMGFGNNSVSQDIGGEQVLVAELPAPASGVSLQDPEFRIWVGGTRNGDVTEGATAIRIYWQEILNRTINTLESVGDISVSLEDRLQYEIDLELSAAGLTGTTITVDVVEIEGEQYFEFRSNDLITVTYAAVDQSKLSLVAAVDITSADYENDASFLKDFPKDQRNFNRLTLGEVLDTSTSDITKIFDPTIKAEAALRFHVRTGGSEVLAEEMTTTGLTNTPFGIPELSFDFKFDASINFDAALEEAVTGEEMELLGDFFSIDTLQFANVTLDVRDFLEATIIPVAEAGAKLVEPILDLVGGAASGIDSVFEARIPLISDVMGEKITLQDAFNIPVDTNGDTAIDRFVDRINEIEDLGANIDLNGFGNFVFGDFDIVLDPSSIFYFPKRKVPVPSALASMEEQIKGLGAENFMRAYTAFDTFQPPGFSIDLFKPQTIFDIVTGQPFNIVSFGLPTIDFDAGFEGAFGFEGFDIGLAAYVVFDSELRLVYDSLGLEKIVAAARTGSSIDWADLVDGFAIQNNPGGFELGGSLDIFTWDGSRDSDGLPTAGSVGIKTDLVELSALIDVGASLGLEVYDPNNDGKLRLDEINEITNNFKNPENLFCIFDITGDAHFTVEGTAKFLDVGGTASLDVGVDGFSLQDLLTGLFGTCSSPPEDPVLAEEVWIGDERVLRINTGPYAASRLHGDVNDEADPFKRVEEDADRRFAIVTEVDGSSIRYDRPGNDGEYLPLKERDLPQASDGHGLIVDDSVADTLSFYEVDDNDQQTLIARFVDDQSGRFYRTDVVDFTFLTQENGAYLRWERDFDIDSYLTKSGSVFKQFIEGSLFENSKTQFNSDGSVDVVTDWIGATTQFSYDSSGRLSGITNRAKNGDTLSSYSYYEGVNGFSGGGLTVSGSNGDIKVSGYGVTDQTYSDTYDRIIAVGGSLDDEFDFRGLSGVPIELQGEGGNDVLFGGDDDDQIDGGSGDDEIDGRAGNDTITVGSGVNSVVDYSDDGKDYFDLSGDEGGVSLTLRGGRDTVIGSRYDDVISASGVSNKLTIYGMGGNDTITGGSGNDLIYGGTGDDDLDGGAGNDEVYGGFGADVVRGGDGDDLVDGEYGDDAVYANDENSGGDGADVVYGGTGNDQLTVGLNTRAVYGSTGIDTLHFWMDASDHKGTLTDAAYTVKGKTNDTYYFGVESLRVTLGDGSGNDNYSLTIDGPELPLTSVVGGTGDDTVVVNRLPLSVNPADTGTVFELGDGSDELTVFDSERPLSLDGQGEDTGGDSLLIDRSADPSSRFAEMTTTTITGLGMGAITYGDFEKIELSLGQGHDVLSIVDTTDDEVTIQGNGGDDTVIVSSIGGKVVVNGDYKSVGTGDTDTVQLLIPSDLTTMAFADLSPNVERLYIDDSENNRSRLDWSYESSGGGAVIYADTYKVLDSLGAELTIFEGSQGSKDTLSIEDLVDVMQTVTIDNSHVEIREGADILSFVETVSDPSAVTYNTTLDALEDIADVAVSPDGKFVYVLGAADDAITVFRRNGNGSLSFVQVLRNGDLGVTGLNGSDLDITADGESLYAAAGNQISHFSRVAETGRLVYRGATSFTALVTHVAADPSGDHVFAAGTGYVAVFDRQASTGALSFADSLSISSSGNHLTMAASVDQTHLFVLTTNPASVPSASQLFQVALESDGSLTLVDTVDTDAVDFVLSADGTNAYAVSRGQVEVYSISNSGMTLEDTTSVTGNPYAKAIAIDPVGSSDNSTPRLITSFDSETAVRDSYVTIDVQTISVTGTESLTGGAWELYLRIDGSGYNNSKVWGTTTLSDGESKDIDIQFELTEKTTFTLWEEDYSNCEGNACGDLAIDPNDKLDSTSYEPADVPGGSLLGGLSFDGNHGSVELGIVATYNYVFGPNPNPILVYSFDTDDTVLVPPKGISLSGTAFFDLLRANPANSNVYAVKNDVDAVEVFTGSGKALSHASSVADGDTQTVDLPELSIPDFTNAIFSQDETHLYSLSSRYGTINVYEWDNATGQFGNLIQTIDAGILPGASLAANIPLTQSGTDNERIYVSNPAEDSIYVYSREDDSASSDFGKLTLESVFTDGLNSVDGIDGVTDLVVSEDGQYLYAAGTDENAIAIFSVDVNDGLLTYEGKRTHTGLDRPVSIAINGNTESTLYVASEGNDSLIVFERSSTDGTLTHLQTFTDNTNGVDGLAGASDVIFGGNANLDGVYVAGRDDDAIAVFYRDPNTGELTFVEAVKNGQGGVLGLEGVQSLAAAGQFVFAAGTGDAIAVFNRESDDHLSLLQRLSDGAADGAGTEVDGIENITAMTVSANDDFLVVGSGGKSGDFGGLTAFGIAASIGTPRSYEIDYSAHEKLELTTQDQGDSVEAGDVTVELSIDTRKGADFVVLRDTPEGKKTDVQLGQDNDWLELYRSGDNSTTTISGGRGEDTFKIYATGSGASTTVDGGVGSDLFEVKGLRLESDVVIQGDSPTGSVGDELQFDAHNGTVERFDDTGAPTTDELSDGQLRVQGESYRAIYSSIETIIELASPLADPGGPYSIDEGDDIGSGEVVALDASQSYIPQGATDTTYRWTLGGAIFWGSSPSISWNDLKSAGLGDDGTYTVSLQISTIVNGEERIDVATTQLTVINVDPTPASTAPPSVELGAWYVLNLSATDPGDDSIEQWTINWGDGSATTIQPGPTAIATHRYLEEGSYTVSISADDEDGGPYQTTRTVDVSASRTISGIDFIDEGDDYVLNLNNPAAADIDSWTIFWGDGTNSAVSGTTNALIQISHTYADSGVYEITAETLDINGDRRSDLSSIDLFVRNLAPTVDSIRINGADATAGVSLPQGAPVQVTVSASDPGTNDSLHFEFDFDGNGRYEYTSNQTNFSYRFNAVGTFNGSVRAIDDDGGVSDPVSFQVTVRNTAPTVSLTLDSDDPREGLPVRFVALGSDPDGAPLTYEWDFDGDSTYELSTGSSATAFHTFPDDGSYLVQVRVTDSDGGATSSSVTVDVRNTDPIFIRPTNYFRLISLDAIDLLDDVADEPMLYIDGEPVFAADLNSVQTYDPLGDPSNRVDLSGYYSQQLTRGLNIELFESVADNQQTVKLGSTLTVPIDQQPGRYTKDFKFSLLNVNARYRLTYEISSGQTMQADVALEGTPVDLLATAFDYGGDFDPLTFEFDIDGDGVYETSGVQGATSVTFPDDGAYPVGVRVRDDDGGSAETVAWIEVQNVIPIVEVTGPESVQEGVEMSILLGDIVDPGEDVVTEIAINWGDGTSDTFTPEQIDALGGVITHTFSGVVFEQTIEVVVVDEDGPHKAGEYSVFVTGSALIDGTLFVAGFGDDDHVTINQFGSKDAYMYPDAEEGDYKVHASFFPSPNDEQSEADETPFQVFDGSGVKRIVVFTYGGDDHVTIAGNIEVPVVIHGGSGDDHLSGAKGPTVLVGGDGDDRLNSGNGNDILIGGRGQDDLNAKKGDDVLVADQTIYDSETAGWDVFLAMLDEWNSGRSYVARIDNLRNGTGEFLAGSNWRLDVGQAAGTIIGDGSVDNLSGAQDDDWFIAETADSHDRKSSAGEQLDVAIAPPAETDPLDVNQDGHVSPIDALSIINLLASASDAESEYLGQGALHSRADVNGDGRVSALDALMVINRLGRQNSQVAPSGVEPQQPGVYQLPVVDFGSDDTEDDLLTLLAYDIARILD
ncbi:MAG: beta-propeller fold lactonase family protein [Planctomycetales bacterium]|nr:beta-propeller fold lactonase family protein [Planctomycetales bacterium]